MTWESSTGRSIFYLNEEQKKTAEEVIAEWTREKVFADPIVTAVEPAQTFWPAENYHQNYFANNPNQPYCMFAVAPKVKKVRQKFASRVKATVLGFSLSFFLLALTSVGAWRKANGEERSTLCLRG